MKVIYLIRHGKSDRSNPNLSDFKRLLNDEGKNEVNLMAKKLNELSFNPDLIICSTAERTVSTEKILAEETQNNLVNCIFDSSIYEATIDYLIFFVNSLPEKNNNVAIIGHNPGITLLSNYLTDDFIDNIPCSGIVKIELNIENWNEITRGIGTNKYFISPKDFD